MVKKIIFYFIFILILIFFQLYATPFFFIYALPILLWLELESKEVFIFLIMAIILDLLSSFYFGFWLFFSIFIFFSTSFILKQYLRNWTLLTFVTVFTAWQIIYGLIYILLSHTAFNWWLLLDLFWSILFCIIIFMVLERLKTWLINHDIISVGQSKEFNLL